MYGSRFFRGLLIPTVALAVALPVAAQPSAEQMRRGRQAVVERFEAAAPEIGEPMPDLTVLDDEGREHPLRALLRGNYSVLVLGCLT